VIEMTGKLLMRIADLVGATLTRKTRSMKETGRGTRSTDAGHLLIRQKKSTADDTSVIGAEGTIQERGATATGIVHTAGEAIAVTATDPTGDTDATASTRRMTLRTTLTSKSRSKTNDSMLLK